MTREEIHEVEDHFAAAALRAKLAGFDAVEIHAAHRYLACQFLSPITNARTDKYGGSLQNRARFLLEVVAKVKKWVGRCFPVFVRLGSIDSVAGGDHSQDAARVAEMLQGSGVAMIDVSGGIMDKWPISMNTVWFAQ
jgi:NADPH2 dehydrogenase